jgi:prolyl oligopeptidase
MRPVFWLATVGSLGLVMICETLAGDRPNYPTTKVDPVVEELHGVKLVDPYRWLEDGDSPEVREWTEKQNAFTRSVLDRWPGRAKLRQRLDTLLDIGSLGVPTPRGGLYFYTKREGKQNQPVLLVRRGLDGKDTVLLDPNPLSKDGTIAIDWYYPSRDGKYIAYGLSGSGDERSTLYVREVATGKDLPDKIENTRACSVAWLPDSSGFYYTRYPAPGSVPKGEENYNRHIYFHKLGTDPATDRKVFGEGRPATDWPTITLSPNGRWLVTEQHQGWAKTEVYFADTTAEKLTFVPLVEKVTANFDVTVRDDMFYVRTNDGAPRYRVFAVDPLKPARDQWREILPESDEVLEAFTRIGETFVTVSMVKASSRLRLLDKSAKVVKEVPLPTLGSIAGLGAEHDGKELLFGFQSFTLPQSVYHIDLTTQQSKLWDRVQADIPFDQYKVEQVTYKSKDGTPVTMFIAARNDVKRDGKTPTLLYGYGGFNISLTPAFSASRFALLERGGVLAVANLRGGGEYGEEWHRAGMLEKKQNTFDDFIAAAEFLIREKYTDADHLAIQGGSNGGLLMGAVTTQRPELFRAVVCQVPLLDMVRYHRFLIAKLWIPEYGSADDPEQFKYILKYSPYHNVREGTKYPAMLITAAESDTRVDPLHARRFAAKMQAATASGADRPILLSIATKAGHGAGKPRSKSLDELTDIYGFIFEQVGIEVK